MSDKDPIKEKLKEADFSSLEKEPSELAHLVEMGAKDIGAHRGFWVVALSAISIFLFMIPFYSGLIHTKRSNIANVQMYAFMEELADDFDLYQEASLVDEDLLEF